MAESRATLFEYRIRLSLPSLIWAGWLRFPSRLRLTIYKTLERFSGCRNRCAVGLPFGLYAKRGSRVTLDEALAIHHVSLRTTIPVPTVLDVLSDTDGGVYLLTTRLPGRQVAQMPRCLDDYNDQEMNVFVTTVGGWLEQLRAIGPSPYSDSVCGFLGGPFYSYRILHEEAIGPFASQEEFHAQWFNTLPEQANPEIRALANRLRGRKRYRLCLTHGDISPNNILVDDAYKPVGLVDFGCATWMPEYWELTYSIYGRQLYPGWVKAFTQILPQYEDELAVEMEQWKYISPW